MANRKSGFTLIELLIVILIIGILAAIAIPFFRGHIIRARLTEVQNTMAILKNAVTNYYQDTEGLWPDCTTLDQIRNSLGVGLESVTRISGVTIQGGVITATVTNIDPLVEGEYLTLTPEAPGDGSIRWIWGTSPAFPVHLRPKS